jgi:hypothetical protein
MRFWLTFGVTMLAATACGSDDSGDDSGGGGNSGTGGSSPTTACDPTLDGVCQNDTDCPLVRSGQARSTASTCGIGCIGDADEPQCGADCVVAESGLTAACAACYVAIVDCSREHCLVECASDPESTDCFDCQVANDCRSAFDDCSGLSTGG